MFGADVILNTVKLCMMYWAASAVLLIIMIYVATFRASAHNPMLIPEKAFHDKSCGSLEACEKQI